VSEENQQPAAGNQPPQLDPAFFTCVNEYLELTNKQAKEQGLKRISMASMYAAARFNSHVYLSTVGNQAAEQRGDFLDYMSQMYRRMLNEHLDGLGAERGIDVGESELAAEYAAAGYTPPGPEAKPAGDKSE
jgi:phage terminase Nu1 subunit (DNA packaging protein)